MSWDSNRTSQPVKSKEEIIYHLRQVNATLEQLAFDSSLTDDFKDPQVARAIKHWTNECRLPRDEAAHFQDNYRVVSVLQKINQLQNCCRQMGITIPLELFLTRKPELGIDFLSKSFGAEVGAAMYHAVSQQSSSSSSTKSVQQVSSPPPVQRPPPNTSPTKKSSPIATTTTTRTASGNRVNTTTRGEEFSRDGDNAIPLSSAAPEQKKVYGPSNEGGGPMDSSSKVIGSSRSSTLFWSTRYELNDPNFSSKTFLLFTLGELTSIVMLGFLIAYFLKLMFKILG